MDIIPDLVDGAIVMSAQHICRGRRSPCDVCTSLIFSMHNWLVFADVPYLILDLMDHKEVCQTFLEELVFIRKRSDHPFFLIGVMEKPSQFLDGNTQQREFPIFVTPEDAVRALRVMNPGLTERPLRIPVQFGTSITTLWGRVQAEAAHLY